MTGPRRLYELHAPAWLARQSERFGRRLTLGTVPDVAWQELAVLGFDLVWVMGVWRRSPASRREALSPEALRRWRRTLPDLVEADVLGSPYAIHDYSLEPCLGEAGELATLRDQLHRLGLGLMLDFVPNHLAVDHVWTESHPGWLVRGVGAAVARHPEWFFVGPRGDHLAHGRDPNFAPWNDTVQVDWTQAGARAALADELARIGEVADAVRVDMAMLGLTDVVARTWAEVSAPTPPPPGTGEYWGDILARVRAARPGLILVAEAYWGLEPELLALGFDYAYDKAVYDLLLSSRAPELTTYLAPQPPWLERGVHFAENHDEERAQVAFGRDRARAATLVALTIPGLALIHDGQIEGARRRAPIHLARAAHGDLTSGEEALYRRMLAVTSERVYRDGVWTPLPTSGDLLAWSWHLHHEVRVVAVNGSGGPASAALDLGSQLPPGVEQAIAVDELTGATVGVIRPGPGATSIHLHLDGWGSALLRLHPAYV